MMFNTRDGDGEIDDIVYIYDHKCSIECYFSYTLAD
jgi:hypothetical protein